MGSTWGNHLKISLFGESHGRGIGVVIDGLPPGRPIDPAVLQAFMDRRAPGGTPWSTPRKETDRAEILSGLYDGKTTGTPLAMLIRNQDTHSADYSLHSRLPRPGHADLTGMMRYQGFGDPRGGGHFSGRLTAPLTFAGAIADQILSARGVRIAAHIASIGGIKDARFDPVRPDAEQLKHLRRDRFPVLDASRGRAMIDAVETARRSLDSIGGTVEVMALGYPAGLGDPMFGGLEPRLASLYFGIPAVKGVEFGAGFGVAERNGSDNNDSPVVTGDGTARRVQMRTNHAGGCDGGISTGMPVIARLAFKPTPSIARQQDTVDLGHLVNETVEIRGRHDPCIVPRAVPVVEAATALVLLDILLSAD